MAVVEPADLLDLVQALLVVVATRVLVMVAHDLQPVLARHVGESIRHSVSWLQEHVFNADRRVILPECVLIQAFSSFHSIPLPLHFQLPISHRQLSIRVPPSLWPSKGKAEEAEVV